MINGFIYEARILNLCSVGMITPTLASAMTIDKGIIFGPRFKAEDEVLNEVLYEGRHEDHIEAGIMVI